MNPVWTPQAGVAVRSPRVLVARGGGGAGYTRVPEGTAVVYEMAAGGHRQLGVVVEVAVRDYGEGAIRRHETVEPGRVGRLGRQHGDAASIASPPVVLTHRDSPELRALLNEVARGEPDVRRIGPGGVRHTVWTACGRSRVAAVKDELARLGPLYIADGHHRMAAADRCGHGYVLAVLFPGEDMRIFPYHRYVSLPRDGSLPDLLAAIEARPVVAAVEECASAAEAVPAAGVVGVRCRGRWFRLRLRPPAPGASVRDTLDVVALDEGVLGPVFGAGDARERTDVTPPPWGGCNLGDLDGVARWCARHDAVAFLPYPPTLEQIMAVADAGSLLPPKSTWFAPKIDATLFVHDPA